MKTTKSLFIGALLTVFSGSAMAQASLDDAIKAIKSSQDKKQVEAIVKEALKPYKKDATALAKIGRAYLDVKDTLNTRKYAQLSVDAEKKLKEGKTGAGYIVLGDLEVYKDNPGDAAAWYQNAIYFNPKNAEAYKKYAFIYRGRDPKQAVETLEQLRSVDPTYPVDAEAGHIYYMSATKNASYMPLALQSYQKVELNDFTKLEPYYMTEYALVAFASQKNDLSKQIAEFGLKANPRHAGYNRLAMYNSVELKQFDEAIKYCDALINKSDSVELSSNDYKFAALAYSGVKNYEEALGYYQKQLSVTEGEAQSPIYKDLSDTYRQLGDMENALACYEKFLTTNPKTSANDYAGFANIYRGMAADQTGAEQEASVNKAVSIYQSLIEKFPKAADDYANFMSARTVSMIDADQKKGLAKPYYEALYNGITAAGVKDNTDKTRLMEACQYLGIYLFKIKSDSAAAKPYFDKIIELDPENELAKQVLSTY